MLGKNEPPIEILKYRQMTGTHGLYIPKLSYESWKTKINRILSIARKQDAPHQKQIWRELALTDLFFFSTHVLSMHYIDNEFGYILCANVQEKKYGRMWVIAREHFKSTIITIASTLQELMRNPEERICIYSYTLTSAQELFYAPVKKELEENPILRWLFDDIIPKDPDKAYEYLPDGTKIKLRWNNSGLVLKRKGRSKECTLESASILSQKIGSHFTKLVYDDTIVRETVQTPESTQTAIDAWQLSLDTGVAEDLKIVVVGTFYSASELYSKIVREKILECIVQPCVTPEGYGIKWSNDAILDKLEKQGTKTFFCQNMCDPRAAGDVVFNEDWLRFWTPKLSAGLNVYMFVDPAGTPTRKRDFTVMWVVGIDENNNCMVLDLVADKLNLTGRTNKLMALHRKYKPKQVFYEKVGLQSDIEHMRDMMDVENYHFNVIPIHQSEPKKLRIEGLQADFENSKIYLPRRCMHVNYLGNLENMVDTFIEMEYKLYPAIVHDDRLDSLALKNHKQVLPYLKSPSKIDRRVQLVRSINRDSNRVIEMDEQEAMKEYGLNNGYSSDLGTYDELAFK